MDDTLRFVELTRSGAGSFVARNPRGGEIRVGSGSSADFTPVELLLAAIGGCSALDVDAITRRRAEPQAFGVRVAADKVREESGNILRNIEVTFTIEFPQGSAGDAAREALPRAIQTTHDRSCTVSRTVANAVPVAMRSA